ncbi:histone deacetylase 6-like [Hyla sarda]|uniref:histone deacetylase 6-like n=1 Tax=Hyla sarda TaxID=327740 RepID=UPI0024C4106C|nr:histone deacetylase 6-like [Hyla sarda]XP_056410465.1 histone deacetylase 6-like [Hyla sarda]XP_056410466.1 histone deacetylase 6-like [Hyla sarda]XP_056410467.1 histone deacetylase 6-like [Hyla sarda]
MSSPQDRRSPGGRGRGVSPGLPTTKKPGKKGQPSPQGGPSLQEVKKRGHRIRKTPERDISHQLDGLDLNKESPAEGTGLVYDDRMTQFFCLWDDKFPECPSRLLAVKEKLVEYGLLERCVAVTAREASEEELLLVHSPDYVELMKSTQKMTEEELRALSEKYDSVYLHPMSFTASCVAAGSVLQLVDKVMRGEVRNGLAVVRPPGHHAYTDQMNGYCMFNQLAIAARYAQHQHGVRRVLIVDWDVHHGQGTQFIFEHDPSVLYFSIHRYENGEFWPHLVESSSAAVGKERGKQYNINVPWNKTGMSDADYITTFLHLLLPIAYEFQPQLVLVAAGYDSVIGDPKGEMSATPACFAHLTHLLMCLAEGRLVLALEGGYNMRSLAEGSCASVKILLGDPCPMLHQPFTPCESALDSISGAIYVHRKYWRCLQDQDFTIKLETVSGKVTAGEKSVGPLREESEENIMKDAVREAVRKLAEKRTGLVYNEQMMEHYNLWDSGHPELPQRIARIFKRHKEMGLVDRCTRLPHRLATTKELQMCHSLSYIEKIEGSSRMKPRDLHRMGSEYNSIYINNRSYHSALLAAGSTFSVVEAVLKGEVQNGVCIVRPPGHHAEPGEACGFCFFNNVALAARYAQSLQSPSEPPLRVMILDWDIHHGNGTQHIFQDDPSVLYVSLHRYDDGLFFPSSEDAAHDKVGSGRGEGFNVNIPWNGAKMGDVEYLLAFHRIVMPIAYEFNPQLVLVSAGFDAARGDPLGGCRISPEGYAHMTHLLMGLAGGKIVVVLEGGYNLTSISDSMSMCTRTLLGDPPPILSDLHAPRPAAVRVISSVLQVHQKYWRSLRINTGPAVESEMVKDLLFSPHKTEPSKESGLSSPKNRSPGRQIVSTPRKHEDGVTPENEGVQQRLSPMTVQNAEGDSPGGRTAMIQDVEDSMKHPSILQNPGGDLVMSEGDSPRGRTAMIQDVEDSMEHPSVLQNPGGDLVMSEGDSPRGRTAMIQDVEDSMKHPSVLQNPGGDLVMSGDSPRGRTAMIQDVEDSMKHPSVLQNPGGDLVMSGDSPRGRTAMIQDVEDSMEHPSVLQNPGGDLVMSGDSPRGRTAMIQDVEDSMEHPSILQNPGGDLVMSGDSPRGRTAMIQDVEDSMEHPSILQNPGGDLVMSGDSPRGRTAMKEESFSSPASQEEGGLYHEDSCVKPDQSYEGESLELVIELQVTDKTPEKERSKPEETSSVEELLRDLHLGDDTKSVDIGSPDSKPVGGARKKTSMGRQSGGAQYTESPAEAAGGDPLSSYEADMDPSLVFSGELFSVTPLPWCPHLESVRALPCGGADVTEPCAECGTLVENWLCLTCYQVLCGRYVSQHMMCHGVSCGHNIVLSFSDLSVWCYSCDAYVHNEVLIPAKQSAYRSKFGEEMPGI